MAKKENHYLDLSGKELPAALALVGHYHGCQALQALTEMNTLKRVIRTQHVWCDYGNNVGRRLYRHFDDPQFEQRRIYEHAMRLGFARENVINDPFDGDRLCELIRRWHIKLIIIATFGGLVPKAAIDAVNGHVFVCHPCFELPEDVEFLPAESKGAQVMDRIVESNGVPANMQIALLRANEFFDGGPVVGETHVFYAPAFSGYELETEWHSRRVRVAQAHSAPAVGSLIRYNLLRQLFTATQLRRRGFKKARLLRQGFRICDLIEAGYSFSKG